MLNFEFFNNTLSFSEALGARKNNSLVGYSSSDTDDITFYATPDYETAERLMLDGDAESAERLERYYMRANYKSARAVSITSRAVVGHTPCVPAYLQGSPASMYATTTRTEPRRTLDLLYSPTATNDINADELAEAGSVVLNLVNIIEASGISVNLYAAPKCSFNAYGAEHDIVIVQLKRAGQRLDLLRLAYCLVNPSFFRRHGFRWLETNGGVTESQPTYGRTQKDLEKIRKALANTPFNRRMEQLKITNFYHIKSLKYSLPALAEALDIKLR